MHRHANAQWDHDALEYFPQLIRGHHSLTSSPPSSELFSCVSCRAARAAGLLPAMSSGGSSLSDVLRPLQSPPPIPRRFTFAAGNENGSWHVSIRGESHAKCEPPLETDSLLRETGPDHSSRLDVTTNLRADLSVSFRETGKRKEKLFRRFEFSPARTVFSLVISNAESRVAHSRALFADWAIRQK